MDEKKPMELAPATKVEKTLDVAATVLSVVPWLGGPVSQVLSGMSIERKMDRVGEVLHGLAGDLRDFKSETSQAYVRSGEFKELLERTLRQVADERNEEKRRAYRLFLRGAIQTPREYDEQRRFLRTLEEMQGNHFLVIRALLQEPEANTGMMGSPLETLRRRLPQIRPEEIVELIAQLNDMRVTSLTSLNTMMTAHGAANLRHAITPYGARFIEFV
jgi:hypothetical protein